MGSVVLNPSQYTASWSAGTASALRRDRLVLIEPHGLLRDGLNYLISTHIRGAAVQCCASVEDVMPGPANLLLIGVDPRRDGDADAVQAKLRALRVRCGDAPVGIVLACDDARLTRAFGTLGVVGVVRWEASLAVAIAAIQLMWVGGFCLPPETARGDEIARLEQSSRLEASLAAPLSSAQEPSRKEFEGEPLLTSRECDVLRILREGRQNKIIAYELGISESTVKVHLRNIMKKLHASNRTQVALGAMLAE
jgi:DNA-binding NarL/FixJ family response regulator